MDAVVIVLNQFNFTLFFFTAVNRSDRCTFVPGSFHPPHPAIIGILLVSFLESYLTKNLVIPRLTGSCLQLIHPFVIFVIFVKVVHSHFGRITYL
jgi:hypothetical protein